MHVYVIIIIVILTTFINIWFQKYNVFYADKPQAPKPKLQTPRPQGPQAQKPPAPKPQAPKPPSNSLIQNAAKFFNKNPSRINNPPDAYKGVVANKYITNKNGQWSPNTAGISSRPDTSKLSTSGGKNWSGTPTQSRIENAAKFFAKYPDRVNDPPAAYKGLIEAGYVKQNGNKFNTNLKPPGQAPARPPARPQGPNTGGSGSSTGGSGSSTGGGGGGWGKGKLPTSNPLPTGVTNATSSTFCANSFTPGGQYPGVKNCSGGRATTAKYVEDDPNNSSAASTFAASAQANPNAIRAAYVPTGSASGLLKNVPTNNDGCPPYLKSNGGCIDWGNSSAANQALSVIKGNIDKAYAAGANAIRLDENDVCETNNGGARSCQGAYGQAMQEVSRYAASKGMGIMGNNSPTTQKALVAAQQSGGATVVGSMLDSSSQYMKDNINQMQSAIGTDIPIFTVQS